MKESLKGSLYGDPSERIIKRAYCTVTLVKESEKGALYWDPSERIIKGFTVL